MAGERELYLQKRRELAPAEARRLSTAVCLNAIRVLQGAKFQGQRVAVYSPLPEELKLIDFQEWLLSQGARLCFPRVSNRQARVMEFVEVAAEQLRKNHLISGAYGIAEPPADWKALDPQKLDLILVPGVAFTSSGQRLGMGAGFYDRFLPNTRTDALRLALAFDFQVASALEQSPWDQPVHWLITETRDLRANPPLIEKLFVS